MDVMFVCNCISMSNFNFGHFVASGQYLVMCRKIALSHKH